MALTVGSDVAVVEPPGSTVGPDGARALQQHRRRRPRGADAAPVRLRRPRPAGPLRRPDATFGQVDSLQDAFVPGSTITDDAGAARSTPDGVLLSAETLHDYQLHPGDLIRLRLQTGTDHAYRPVPFHVLGLVTEWPTAPKDSFIVANADYVARATGSDAVGTFLVSSDTPAATAAALRTNADGVGIRRPGPGRLGRGCRGHERLGPRRHRPVRALPAGPRLRGAAGAGLLRVASWPASSSVAAHWCCWRRSAPPRVSADGSCDRGERCSWSGRARRRAHRRHDRLPVGQGAHRDLRPASGGATIPWTYLIVLLALVVAVTVGVVAGVGRLAARAGPSELRDL